jgi:hypothetical protein
MGDQSHVLQPMDVLDKTESSCQRRLHPIRRDHQPRTHRFTVLGLLSRHATDTLAVKQRLPHPEAGTEFDAFPTRLFYQQMVQHQPG